MKTWLKNKMRAWLFPEYDRVGEFMSELDAAKEEALGDGKTVTIKGPLVLVGSLSNCKVNIKPTINPEIVLSKLTLDAALSLYGDGGFVQSSSFRMDASKAINLPVKKEKE